MRPLPPRGFRDLRPVGSLILLERHSRMLIIVFILRTRLGDHLADTFNLWGPFTSFCMPSWMTSSNQSPCIDAAAQ